MKTSKSLSARAALVGAVLALAAGIGEIIYGATYSQYADYVVVICYLAGAALLGAYALIDKTVTDWFGLLGVFAAAYGLGLFIANSYNVWADAFGNWNQYGSITGAFNFFNSQGGPIPAVVLIVLALAAAICGIISTFHGKEAAK